MLQEEAMRKRNPFSQRSPASFIFKFSPPWLPFPLADLLGHHGVYFALLMSENEVN
jgi:hypothetical protein